MNGVSEFLAYWIVLNLSVIAVWDLAVLFLVPSQMTVSRFLYEAGQATPILYLWVGVTIGHLLFPLIVRNGGQ